MTELNNFEIEIIKKLRAIKPRDKMIIIKAVEKSGIVGTIKIETMTVVFKNQKP